MTVHETHAGLVAFFVNKMLILPILEHQDWGVFPYGHASLCDCKSSELG